MQHTLKHDTVLGFKCFVIVPLSSLHIMTRFYFSMHFTTEDFRPAKKHICGISKKLRDSNICSLLKGSEKSAGYVAKMCRLRRFRWFCDTPGRRMDQ